MLSYKAIENFLRQALEDVEIPGDISVEDLVIAFKRYCEQDSYEWLRDNFKSFFNHGDPDWTEIRRIINEGK